MNLHQIPSSEYKTSKEKPLNSQKTTSKIKKANVNIAQTQANSKQYLKQVEKSSQKRGALLEKAKVFLNKIRDDIAL